MKLKVRYKVVGHVTVEAEGFTLEEVLRGADACANSVDLGDLEDVEFVDREVVND